MRRLSRTFWGTHGTIPQTPSLLQEALELPLIGSDPYVEAFCAANSCTQEELITACDELGINVVVLEDLIRLQETGP